jgi:hypothetical protein
MASTYEGQTLELQEIEIHTSFSLASRWADWYLERVWRDNHLKQLIFGIISVAALCSADTITGLCNTGQETCEGALAANGAADSHYVIVSGPVTGTTYVGRNSAWVANDSLSQWITPAGGVDGVAGGYYTYETTFQTVGTSFIISGLWTSDNAGYDIILNGKSLRNGEIAGSGLIPYGTGPFSFQTVTPFSISSGFVSGVNTLDFVIGNGDFAAGNDPGGPSGLRVEMTGVAATPEPGTMALSSLFLIAIVLSRRWAVGMGRE